MADKKKAAGAKALESGTISKGDGTCFEEGEALTGIDAGVIEVLVAHGLAK